MHQLAIVVMEEGAIDGTARQGPSGLSFGAVDVQHRATSKAGLAGALDGDVPGAGDGIADALVL